jgi:hypothetical protein
MPATATAALPRRDTRFKPRAAFEGPPVVASVPDEPMPPVPSVEPTEVVFYAPGRRGTNVVIPDREARNEPGRPMLSGWKRVVKFQGETLRTRDPEVIAAVRRGVAAGRYFEANLPEEAAIVCEFCQLAIRNTKAYARHVREHIERQSR